MDGLLRTGRRRPSILAGKAGDGKSTLAKQLAITLAQGKPFLGRETKRSPSIYWQTEDEVPDVVEALLQMGYVPGRDAEIYILDGTAEENNVHTLRQALLAHPDAKVVIVETLDDLIKSRDSNSGTDVREAFGLLHTAVMKDFAPNVAVLRAAQSHINTHIIPRLGDCALTDVDNRTVQAFITALATGGRTRKTIENVLNTFSSILNSAKTFGYACGNFQEGN